MVSVFFDAFMHLYGYQIKRPPLLVN